MLSGIASRVESSDTIICQDADSFFIARGKVSKKTTKPKATKRAGKSKAIKKRAAPKRAQKQAAASPVQ